VDGKLIMKTYGDEPLLKPMSGIINKKLGMISLEYEDLMNSQLDSQR